ncbi:MAG: hypothetical protein IKN91_04155 [Paludibacteraceae bacterium]|nr:hypothetical protein [Paludibacteraceae bacterium]
MLYRFEFKSEESLDFSMLFDADPAATFLDLHKAILEAVKYPNDQMTSFFLCDSDWERQAEITLVDMEGEGFYDNRPMEKTLLEDVLEDEGAHLIYVFDPTADRYFYGELIAINTRGSVEGVELVDIEGRAPEQIKKNKSNNKGKSKVSLDLDDDYGFEGFNEDDLDASGFSLDGSDGLIDIETLGGYTDDY